MSSIIQLNSYRLPLVPLFDYLYLKPSLSRCLGCPAVAPPLFETSRLRLLFAQSPFILLPISLLFDESWFLGWLLVGLDTRSVTS